MRRSRLYDNTRTNALLLVVVCINVGLALMIMLTHSSTATISAATVPLTAAFIIASVLLYRERGRIARDRRRTLCSFQAARRRRQGMV
jgi:hypothetical protein